MPLFGLPGERIGFQLYPTLSSSGAPPLVLLHGFTTSSAAFAPNIPALREHFTVLTAELLGHGESESPEGADAYTPECAVRRLLGLFDQLGFGKVLLCGHSLGGALALRLALDAPDRVAGVVVLNSMSAAGTPAWREQAAAGMAMMAARARRDGTGFLRDTRLYPAHSKRLDETSRQLLVEAFGQMTADGFAGTAEGLTTRVNAWERHPELAVPLLVIVGDRDREFVETAPAFISRFPAESVHTAVIAGAGHAANIEEPRAFEAAVVAFARELGLLPPAAAAAQRGLADSALTALGVLLVAGGLGLLAMSFAVKPGGSGSRSQVLAARPSGGAETTPALVAVAGERTAGPASATPAITVVPGTATALAQDPPPPATPTPAAEATPAPAYAPPPADAPMVTATPTPDSAPAPSPTIAPTPAGARAAIGGPASAAAGDVVTFGNASSPGDSALRWTWSTDGVVVNQPNIAVLMVRFPTNGCHVVGLTVVFKDGVTRIASRTIAVGDVTCG